MYELQLIIHVFHLFVRNLDPFNTILLNSCSLQSIVSNPLVSSHNVPNYGTTQCVIPCSTIPKEISRIFPVQYQIVLNTMVLCLAIIFSLILRGIIEIFIVPIVIVINLFTVAKNLILLQAIDAHLIRIYYCFKF